MRIAISFFVLLLSTSLFSQDKITKDHIAAAEKLSDIALTDAERDSLLDEVSDNLRAIKAIHGQHLDNWTAPALYFDPIPAGRLLPFDKTSQPIKWDIPKNVEIPKKMSDLAFYNIKQLAGLIKYKKITCVELTKFFINRFKTYGDTLHCLITLMEETALKQAEIVDKEIASGKYRGILHGIPFGVKDLLAVKGTLTTWGAAPFKNQSIDQTATVVQKLEAAGAVLIAKLSLGSLAMGDVWFKGRTRNPWDLKRGSSGSSAGSASAVVAGLVPFTIGSETLGSIVSPSTVCGATGLRPTFGRVSRYGAMTLCWSLDKLGPIVRSAEDAAIVFDAIRGADGFDKTVHEQPFNYTDKIDIKKLKIGYPKNIFDTLNKSRNEWRIIESLEKLGVKLIPFEFKTSVPTNIIDVVLMSECAAAFDELTRTNLDDELTVQTKNAWPNFFRAARFIPAVDYVNANRLRTKMIAEIDNLLQPYDAVITTNFDANQLQITNLTGHPVVAMPRGFRNGLPTSATILGNYFSEATILAVAKIIQDNTDFEDKHPEMFSF